MAQRVVVLGAGMTGLCAAWELACRGAHVTVVERESQVGGLWGSFQRDGFSFDFGPHGLNVYDREAFDKIKGLLGDELQYKGVMQRSVVFGGKEYPYPLNISSILSNTPLPVILRAALSYAFWNLARSVGFTRDDNFEEWIRNRYGRVLYDMFFRSYTQKVWGMDPAELAATFAAERIRTIRPAEIIKILAPLGKRSGDRQKRLSIPSWDPKGYSYPVRGAHSVPEAIAREVRRLGGEILTDCEIEKVSSGDGIVREVAILHKSQRRSIPGEFFVSTIPIAELVRRLDSTPDEMLGAARSLRYRELTLLYLIVRKARILNVECVYYHDPDVIFHRVHENKLFSDRLIPSSDWTGLCAEITNQQELTDPELYEAAVKAFERYQILTKEDIKRYFVVRLPYAYPLYDVQYKEKLERLNGFLGAFRNLISAGRQGQFRYIDAEHCIKLGACIARHVLEGAPKESINEVVAGEYLRLK